MIDKFNKIDCNGCKVCKNICPTHAIQYEVDNEGFWYPKVNHKKCIECGLCIKKCPNKTSISRKTQAPKIFAAWSKSSEIRLASTSGGVFYEMAKYTLKKDGYVVGCVYDNDFKGAHHTIIHSMDELNPLLVSKYVESDTEDIYPQVETVIKYGKPVVFVGSPCQAAGLISYLDKEYDNLIICDFLCRGANSPKAHKKYIEYLEKVYGGKIIHLRSKDKRNGWNRFGQSAIFSNGKEYFSSRDKDLRIVAYHQGNLMMRESCHDCKFKKIPRVGSDITLGDFWGINPKEVKDVEKGISVVMLNTEKGKQFFDKIQVEKIEKTLKDALKGNIAIFESAARGKNRDCFLSELDSLPFDQLVAKYKVTPKKKSIMLRIIRKIFREIKNYRKIKKVYL